MKSHEIIPSTINAIRQSNIERRKVAKGAVTIGLKPTPEEVMLSARPRLLTNHLETVALTTEYSGPVPRDNNMA
jgi:hypothetical protein